MTLADSLKICSISGKSIFNSEQDCLDCLFPNLTEDQADALRLLWAAECTYETPVTFYAEEDDPDFLHCLNMNNTFGWALAMGEPVPFEQLGEVARLFKEYGDCGLIYWVSERNGQMRSEFPWINRKIGFVRNEESISAECGGDITKLAYSKNQYTLGVD